MRRRSCTHFCGVMATEPSFQQLVDETFRGTFEIHIFVAPLNAPEPVLQVLWADRG